MFAKFDDFIIPNYYLLINRLLLLFLLWFCFFKLVVFTIMKERNLYKHNIRISEGYTILRPWLTMIIYEPFKSQCA